MPPQRVGFLRRFGLKTGIDFAHFGLELGMVFEETMGVHGEAARKNARKKAFCVGHMSRSEGHITSFTNKCRGRVLPLSPPSFKPGNLRCVKV